jgi:hypothetical protein
MTTNATRRKRANKKTLMRSLERDIVSISLVPPGFGK